MKATISMSLLPAACCLELPELFRREQHERVLLDLEALHHLVARNDLPVALGHILLLHPGTVLCQQVEAQAGRTFGGRIQAHRDGDQVEGEGERSDRAGSHQ